MSCLDDDLNDFKNATKKSNMDSKEIKRLINKLEKLREDNNLLDFED